MTSKAETARRQKLFDRAYARVTTQGGPSVNSEGACVYRGDNGRACGAGALIDDAHYHWNLEEKSVLNSHVLEALEKSGVNPADVEFVGCLQDAHDDASDAVLHMATYDQCEAFLQGFENKMRDLAAAYKLIPPA